MLREEHGDVIRESVRAVAQELMEAEVSELIGAARGERSEDRATHRNGYRRRGDVRTLGSRLIVSPRPRGHNGVTNGCPCQRGDEVRWLATWGPCGRSGGGRVPGAVG